jgi:hypothetical protein
MPETLEDALDVMPLGEGNPTNVTVVSDMHTEVPG